MDFESVLTALFAVILIYGLIQLILHVLFAIGAFSVLKHLGFAHPWLAWIPILNIGVLGLCCEQAPEGQTCCELASSGQTYMFGHAIPTKPFAFSAVILTILPTWLYYSTIPGAFFISVVLNIVAFLVRGTIFSIIYGKVHTSLRADFVQYILGYLSALMPFVSSFIMFFTFFWLRRQKKEGSLYAG